MKNYKIIVEYDGTKYNGWQRQGNTKNTLQEKFENVISLMCGKETEIFASGRTDRGVHAKGQVANFKCDVDMTANDVLTYLNRYLPEDVRVTDIEEVDDRFHSRLNAVGKTYEYAIATKKPDVFIRKYVYFPEEVPDVDKMKAAAKKVLGTHDFHGFSSVGKTKKSTVRTVNSVEIEETDGVITISINGNGFLYNMVRIIVGTLYEIGIGKKDEGVIDEIFETKSREKAGVTMPAEGLCLMEVFY